MYHWYKGMLGHPTEFPIVSPYDLSVDLLIDADNAAGFTYSSGNVVSAYVDRGAVGYTLSQGTVSKQPTRVTAAIDGQAVLRFDGSNDVLSGGDIIDIGTENLEVWVVVKLNGTGAQGIIAKSIYAGAHGRYGLFVESGSLTGTMELQENNYATAMTNQHDSFILIRHFLNRNDRSGLVIDTSSFFLSSEVSVADQSYDANTGYRLLVGAYNNPTDTGEQYYLNGDLACAFIKRDFFGGDTVKGLNNYFKTRFPSLSYTLQT